MSLTRDDLEDIKQLMEAVVSAALKEQNEYLDKRLDEQDKHLDKRLSEQDEKLDAILDSVGGDLNGHDEKLEDHEARIVRLERRTA